MRSIAAVAVLVSVLGGFAPAAALHGRSGPDFTPNLRPEQVWFRCGSGPRVSPHGGVPVGWSTTAPARPLADGGGCGVVDATWWSESPSSGLDVVFAGAYAGNLDRITVEAFVAYAGPYRVTDEFGKYPVNVRLAVDGTPLLGSRGRTISFAPAPTATPGVERLRFTITGLGLLSEAHDSVHQVEVVLAGHPETIIVGNEFSDYANIWLFDAAEVPGGLTFNPAQSEPVTLSAAGRR